MKPSNFRTHLFTALLLLFLLAGAAGCNLLNPAAEPTATSPGDEILLQWFRSGGIAGFCDEMTITTDAVARISSCSTPELNEIGAGQPVPENIMVMLNSAAANLDSFTDVQTDDATADSMTITLVFNGNGFGEPEETDQEGLSAISQDLYTQFAAALAEGCTITAEAEISVYQRPELEAELFGVLAAGESVRATMQSDEGWLGFDPGVAQAANTGVFRLRWIAPFAQFEPERTCEVLPIAPPISTAACYTVAMSETMVRSMPQEGAEMVASLPPGGYAAVTGRTMDDWLQVNLGESSQPQEISGWVSPMESNLNGPCEELEIVEGP